MSRRTDYTFEETTADAPSVWRSLESKQDPQAAAERAKAEFKATAGIPLQHAPSASRDDATPAPEGEGKVGRRGFMLFTGASAVLAGCARRPLEKVLPYTKQPEHAVPGISSYYATVYESRGEAVGLLVESHEGRPTKVEGNPDHPASLGASDLASQAAIWDLYDPDRSQKFAKSGTEADAADFDAAFKELAEDLRARKGAKLAILAPASQSPTFLRLRDLVKAKLPEAKLVSWSSVDDSLTRAGAKLAFEQAAQPVYALERAKVIVAVDSDLLGDDVGSLKNSRGFAQGRKLRSKADVMNRLYVVEPSLSVTGMAADHRLRLAASECEGFLVAIASELSKKHGVDLGALGQLKSGVKIPEKWVQVVAKELAQNKGKSVVSVGPRQPARVQALGHAINWALGNAEQTIQFYPAADKDATVDALADLAGLTKEMAAGGIDHLLILGQDPVYSAPSDLAFGEALTKVKHVIHLSRGFNQTSRAAEWHAPEAHPFEAWGDLRSRSGAYSIQQPLTAPLFPSKTALELLATLAGEEPKPYDLVRATFSSLNPAATAALSTTFRDKQWKLALKKGVVSEAAPRALAGLPAKLPAIAAAFEGAAPAKPIGQDNLEVTFVADARLFDGQSANNPWLLEVPDPITKLVWDNAACISPATAKTLGLVQGDMVRLAAEGAKPLEIGVFVQPGQADFTIQLTLGWGRQQVGRYGSKKGFDVHGLRTTKGYHTVSGVTLTKLAAGDIAAIADRFASLGKASEPTPILGRTGPSDPFDLDKRYRFVQTQEHGSMEGRPIAIDSTYEDYKKNDKFVQFKSPDPKVLPLWNKVDYSKGHKWGMAIDLNACLGCNACVVACQSENNVPSVGKGQVEMGREMSWLRIDRYYLGEDENNPQVAIQPVACVHCEEAPCENVCPVNATEHSPEGLNDMAYNRCIGTRYCANNCPYKVRRFNFLNYHGEDGVLPETEKMHMNPNVTVRMRGVMEKCNYCVQRIQETKIHTRNDGRAIKDGDIRTACQQACASEAIVFGDLNDPTSEVSKLHKLDRAYRLLAEIGTWPRTTYLGKIRNPNPELV